MVSLQLSKWTVFWSVHKTHPSLVSDEDVVVHGHWNVVDVELERVSLGDAHESGAGPGALPPRGRLPDHHLRVLEQKIVLDAINMSGKSGVRM